MTYTKMQIQIYMYDIYGQEVKDMQEYRKLQERTNEDLVKEYQTTHNEDLFRALLEKIQGSYTLSLWITGSLSMR